MQSEKQKHDNTNILTILAVDSVSIAETLASLNYTGKDIELRNEAIQLLKRVSELIEKMSNNG